MKSSSSSIKVKICGIKDADNLKAALDAGADYVGFLFVPSSSRYISPAKAGELAKQYSMHIRPSGRKLVAVFSNPTDQDLADVLTIFSPDILQLHGSETIERIAEIAAIYDLSIMKAISVASAADIEQAKTFIGHADMLLFDTKGEIDSNGIMQNGGTGKTFDWNLLKDFHVNIPWFLSGGLNLKNVQQAIHITHATHIDVSSGVESSRGQKDPELIRAFIHTAKTSLDQV